MAMAITRFSKARNWETCAGYFEMRDSLIINWMKEVRRVFTLITQKQENPCI